MDQATTTWPVRSLAVRVFAVILAAIGAVLAVGGAWLLSLGGSPYYLVAGLGLVAAGVLLVRLRLVGVWVYSAIFVATLACTPCALCANSSVCPFPAPE